MVKTIGAHIVIVKTLCDLLIIVLYDLLLQNCSTISLPPPSPGPRSPRHMSSRPISFGPTDSNAKKMECKYSVCMTSMHTQLYIMHLYNVSCFAVVLAMQVPYNSTSSPSANRTDSLLSFQSTFDQSGAACTAYRFWFCS